MILTEQIQIDDYTQRGWWGKETLSDLFEKNASKFPERMAIIDPPDREKFTVGAPQRLSYGELERRVTAYAARLLETGVGTDDIVVYQLPNIHEISVILLACARIGAIASPILVQFDLNELEQIFGQLKPKVFISVSRFKQRELSAPATPLCLKYGCALLTLDHDFDGQLSDAEEQRARGEIADQQQRRPMTADDITTICWTSGTEGNPKGVMRSHNQWMVVGRAMRDGAKLQCGDVILNARPLVNMAAIGGGFYSWLICAGTLVLHHPLNPQLVLEQIEQERVNLTFMPPAFIVGLLKDPQLHGKSDLSSLRTMGSGSAAIPPWAIEQMKQQYDIDIINFFGSNEGVILLSNPDVVPDPTMRATYFPRFGRAEFEWPTQPVSAEMETRLVDLDTGLEITEVGRAGELRVKGSGIFSGYFNAPELTRAAFDDQGFYRSGDLFEIAGEGELARFYHFVGRCREVIIRGGFNIAPAEIDSLLSDHPLISEIATFGFPDDRLGEKVGVAVIPQPDAQIRLNDIVDYLKEKHIAVFKLPEKLLVLNELPRNAMLKVLRWKLTELSTELDG